MTFKKGWRPQIAHSAALEIASSVEDPKSPPLATLCAWLEEHRIHQADMDVALSNRYVRYTIVPWSDDLRSRKEQEALARVRFESAYGSAADDWEIKLDSVIFGRSTLACAIPRAVVAETKALCKEHRLRLRSLEPYLVRASRQWGARISARNALLVAAEPSYMVTLVLNDGQPHGARSSVVRDRGGGRFEDVVARERLLHGLQDDAPAYICHSFDWNAGSNADAVGIQLAMSIPPGLERCFAIGLALCGVTS